MIFFFFLEIYKENMLYFGKKKIKRLLKIILFCFRCFDVLICICNVIIFIYFFLQDCLDINEYVKLILVCLKFLIVGKNVVFWKFINQISMYFESGISLILNKVVDGNGDGNFKIGYICIYMMV